MRIIVLSFATILSGCTASDAIRSGIAQHGAEVSDRLREDAEFILCRGITVGAWVRAYGTDKERADAWKKLCSAQIKEAPGG